jgi:hypothetical protein
MIFVHYLEKTTLNGNIDRRPKFASLLVNENISIEDKRSCLFTG